MTINSFNILAVNCDLINLNKVLINVVFYGICLQRLKNKEA
jgi:hypothetical protein